MNNYLSMTKEQLSETLAELKVQYEEIKNSGLTLDMSRGKPGADQLKITQDMLGVLDSAEDCIGVNKFDYRNYGLLDGIPEAKEMFADLFEIPAKNIIVAGNSSLNLMYDTVARAMLYGVYASEKPWCKLDKVKFLCPCPGYDRHFKICESLGIEMINVPMNSSGPDMDVVERLVSEDDSIKGIWCVPKFSNPDGITYSDEVVERFAKLKTKASDFRIFWDNAYAIHEIYDTEVKLANLFELAKKYGNEDKVFMFASTSKVSFPGSGVAIMAASDNNMKLIKSVMSVQTIGFDKLNQLRHVLFFKNADGVRAHMKLHAEILSKKFDIVLGTLKEELGKLGIANWESPLGGYFISLNVLEGCATRVYNLCKEAGVTLTEAGATFPYGKDPLDRNIRIAPSFPPNDELATASRVLCICTKLACCEKLLESK